MVIVEDENDIQELSSIAVPLEESVGYGLEELPHQGLRSTLDRLPLETLRLLCSGEGVSDTGGKKDLIERLVGRVVSKTKGKNKAEGSSRSNGSWLKEGDAGVAGMTLDGIFQKSMDLGEGSGKPQEWAAPDAHYIALERSLEKSMQATLEKVVVR